MAYAGPERRMTPHLRKFVEGIPGIDRRVVLPLFRGRERGALAILDERMGGAGSLALDKPLLQSDIGVLGLRGYVVNALRKNNVNTVGQLIRHREQDIIGMRNLSIHLGKGSLAQIKAALETHGLQLAE